MNAPSIVHSALLSSLAAGGFFPSTCDIQEQAAGQDALGTPSGSWAGLAGHTGLKAAVQVPSLQASGERRETGATYGERTRVILLAGSYPSITSLHRAVVTAGPNQGTYNVLAVDGDSQGASTRLLVEVVS